MSYIEYVEKTIGYLEGELFNSFRNTLVDDYISFAAIRCENVTPEIMKEKLCDYFEKVELFKGKTLDKMIEKYMADLDSLVGPRIATVPKAKKGEEVLVPRARKYYERATAIRKDNKMTKHGLRDFSRIMLCLYSEIINNNFKPIENFDYSLDRINLTQLLTTMKSESGDLDFLPKLGAIDNVIKRNKFVITEPYGEDRCTFILVIMMFYYIRSTAVTED